MLSLAAYGVCLTTVPLQIWQLLQDCATQWTWCLTSTFLQHGFNSSVLVRVINTLVVHGRAQRRSFAVTADDSWSTSSFPCTKFFNVKYPHFHCVRPLSGWLYFADAFFLFDPSDPSDLWRLHLSPPELAVLQTLLLLLSSWYQLKLTQVPEGGFAPCHEPWRNQHGKGISMVAGTCTTWVQNQFVSMIMLLLTTPTSMCGARQGGPKTRKT